MDNECDPPPAKKIALDRDVNELYTPTEEINKIKQVHHKKVEILKKKLKLSQQKSQRLKKRNTSLKGIVISVWT